MLIYGHGSAEAGNRINTRESFVALQRMQVDGVELDVRRSRDGELLVIHDHFFEDGRLVAETKGADRPDDVILLAEALDLCAGRVVNIEIKNYPGDPAFDESERITDAVITLLEARNDRDNVLISCFGIGSLDRVRARRPDLATAHLVLSRRPADQVLEPCIEHGHRITHPYESMVDAAFMRMARDHDLTVNVWTGLDESDQKIAELAALGVDGLITGAPERALRIREDAARPPSE